MGAGPRGGGKNDHRLRTCQLVIKLLGLALEERVALSVAGERRKRYGLGDPVRDVEGPPALLPTGAARRTHADYQVAVAIALARPAKSLGRDCLLS